MRYIDGFVTPVAPGVDRDDYRAFAAIGAAILREYGALRVVEAWNDDLPVGSVTDFRRAVDAGDGESVVFSWIEWPDRATRDAGMARMIADPRMQPDVLPMPFDPRRMIYGGFATILDEQAGDTP